MNTSDRNAAAKRMTDIIAREIGGACYVSIVTGAHRFDGARFAVAFDSEAHRVAGVSLFAAAKMPLLGTLDYGPDADEPEYPNGTFMGYFGDAAV